MSFGVLGNYVKILFPDNPYAISEFSEYVKTLSVCGDDFA
jgi:hypothetical protein